MSYLPITIAAYILNGISLVIDRSLVTSALKSPFVYTFYIGALSLIALFLIPFGYQGPGLEAWIFAILAGIIFDLALLTFFAALRKAAPTVVSPITGTLNPLFAFLIGYIFLAQTLSNNQLIAFVLLISGGILLTINLWWKKHDFGQTLGLMVLSGFFFGLAYVLLREAFQMSSFIDGLVISRVAAAAFVFLFLLFPSIRHQIFASKITKHHFINSTSILVATSQLFGAVSGFMISYAISIVSPAIVNSLYGIQYLILLALAIVLAKSHPEILDEKLNLKVLMQKIVAIILISGGLYFLLK